MRILFLRESEGVYKFGQRRVFVKVEKGNQIRVKVGGGFMGVQQFLDGYQKSELVKNTKNEVLARFQNKIRLQQIAALKSDVSNETLAITSKRRQRNRSEVPREFTGRFTSQFEASGQKNSFNNVRENDQSKQSSGQWTKAVTGRGSQPMGFKKFKTRQASTSRQISQRQSSTSRQMSSRVKAKGE